MWKGQRGEQECGKAPRWRACWGILLLSWLASTEDVELRRQRSSGHQRLFHLPPEANEPALSERETPALTLEADETEGEAAVVSATVEPGLLPGERFDKALSALILLSQSALPVYEGTSITLPLKIGMPLSLLRYVNVPFS